MGTIFLNMWADKLHGTDPEDVIVKAFKLFDKENKGVVPVQTLQEVLKSQADRFNDDEFKQFLELAKPNEEGLVDYKALCYTLTHGGGDDEDWSFPWTTSSSWPCHRLLPPSSWGSWQAPLRSPSCPFLHPFWSKTANEKPHVPCVDTTA